MTEYHYPCDSKEICNPVSVKLKKGLYKLELWGAQGGNVTGAQGGSGGYSSGILRVSAPIKLYLFIGASGYTPTTTGFTKTSFNGGGCGQYNDAAAYTAPGGGSTDIRTSKDIKDRIIVAGGGGGAGLHPPNVCNRGGYGGGITGGDGLDGIDYSYKAYAKGGGAKNDEGGTSSVQNGIALYGGNQTISRAIGAGGGGGYFGGGSGYLYGASGGGGSGFVDSIFMYPIIRRGNESAPNFYTNEFSSDGHKGDGVIRITDISCKSFKKHSEHCLNIFFPIFLFIS
jgi:hypothetical protein